jgi:hypothetical protein
MGSTLKVRASVKTTLIEKIKADLKMRAKLKAHQMLLRNPNGAPKVQRRAQVVRVPAAQLKRTPPPARL